jgi:tRNA threonylcarbamoyladenosine biosynthesis protein TsaE
MEKIIYQNLSEINTVAEKIVKFANSSSKQILKIWRFEGEMGAGKTTLIKAIGRLLGVEDMIHSPTYSLVNEYFSREYGQIYHFDFYRLRHETEALDFGVEEYLDSGHYCWLEWASQIPTLLPPSYLCIEIFSTDSQRIIQLSKHGEGKV